APEIRQMLFTNVGKTQHVGKVPARSCKRLKLKKLVEELKQQLEDEVKNENYEIAARLRDTINNLERDVEKHS
ncbi:MAG: UvrB/UvrC motif-containing protein, partial [Vulcanimicrobiota bacterium]